VLSHDVAVEDGHWPFMGDEADGERFRRRRFAGARQAGEPDAKA
jgi:hypothetical protein